MFIQRKLGRWDEECEGLTKLYKRVKTDNYYNISNRD